MYVKIGKVGCFRLEFQENSGRIPEEFQNTVLCFADMKCSYLSADKMSSEFFNNSSQKKADHHGIPSRIPLKKLADYSYYEQTQKGAFHVYNLALLLLIHACTVHQ